MIPRTLALSSCGIMYSMEKDTGLAEYQNEVRVKRALSVMEYQVTNGGSTEDACKAMSVPVRSFYRWVREGLITEYLDSPRSGVLAVLADQALMSLPKVLEYITAIATGAEVVRGASPVAAAKWVASVAGISIEAAEDKPDVVVVPMMPIVLARMPEVVRFVIRDGKVSQSDDGSIEIIDGEYVDA